MKFARYKAGIECYGIQVQLVFFSYFHLEGVFYVYIRRVQHGEAVRVRAAHANEAQL